METADFEFVVGNTPDQLKGGTTRRLRSHLSKRGWQAYRLSATKTESTSTSTSISEAGSSTLARQERELRKRHRKKTHVTVTFECALDHDGQLPDLINKHNATSDSVDRRSTTLVPHIEYQLGGGRVDPFRAYPGQRRPYVPALVDHCKMMKYGAD